MPGQMQMSNKRIRRMHTLIHSQIHTTQLSVHTLFSLPATLCLLWSFDAGFNFQWRRAGGGWKSDDAGSITVSTWCNWLPCLLHIPKAQHTFMHPSWYHNGSSVGGAEAVLDSERLCSSLTIRYLDRRFHCKVLKPLNHHHFFYACDAKMTL